LSVTRNQVVSRFSTAVVAQQMLEMYRDVASQRR
jgi:hypothetical protein